MVSNKLLILITLIAINTANAKTLLCEGERNHFENNNLRTPISKYEDSAILNISGGKVWFDRSEKFKYENLDEYWSVSDYQDSYFSDKVTFNKFFIDRITGHGTHQITKFTRIPKCKEREGWPFEWACQPMDSAMYFQFNCKKVKLM